MAVNVEVSRKNNENSMCLLRRFSRRIKGSGVLPRVRSIRYSGRNLSEYVQKKQRLSSLKKQAEFERLLKLGKIPEPQRGRRR